jgi:uncharacterized membrane protein YkvA (DUF1232 family)
MDRLRRWAEALKRDVLALWFCYRNPRVPLVAKILAVIIVAYALSPIDLIPDFIPVLGYLDELILLPAGIYVVLRLIPSTVLQDSRERAAEWLAARNTRPVSYTAAVVIVLIWLVLTWLLLRLADPLLPGPRA